MFFVLVKFKASPVPELFGTMHVSHAARLATMDGVQWVSPTIANGSALEHRAPAGGTLSHSVMGEPRITGYLPERDGC